MFAISTIGVYFSFAVQCFTIKKFPITADQSLYVKLLNNVNIDQIDEVFSGPIKITIISIRK